MFFTACFVVTRNLEAMENQQTINLFAMTNEILEAIKSFKQAKRQATGV